MHAPKLRAFLSRRPAKYAFAATAILLLAAAGWWMSGRKVWTDGQNGPTAIRVFTSDHDPRQVLWTPSRPVLSPDLASGAGPADHVYEPAISPDGTELFFVGGKAGLPVGEVIEGGPLTTGADIYVSRRRNNQWLLPQRLDAVSSRYDDLGPRMTADGRFLLFYSNRPGGQGGYDLWAAGRDDDGVFGDAFNLGPGVNSEFDEYGPGPTADGSRLYFSTNRTAAGKEQHTAWRATIRAATTTDFDLWSAELAEVANEPKAAESVVAASSAPPVLRGSAGDPFAADDPAPPADAASTQPATQPTSPATQPAHPPRRILRATAAQEVAGVNTTFHEGAPCISPAGDFLYFASNRPEGHGKFDLYRSRLIAGSPAEPENLGPSVNTADNETDPQLAHGGFRLYYSSDRGEEVSGWSGGEEVLGWSGGGVVGSPTDGRTTTGDAARSAPDSQSATAPPNHPTTPTLLPPAPPNHPTTPTPLPRGYDLYEADSREVYPERQGRPLPVIGWKLLAMLAGALLLLPLLFFLVRNVNRRNLSLLQRCFVAALCVYALFLFWTTSKHVVMEAYPTLAADLGFVEVKINLDPKIEESNVAMAIRQQSSNDLPIAAAPAGQLTQQAAGGEVIEAAPDVAVNVPQAAVGADAMSVVVAPQKTDVPRAATPAVSMVSPLVGPTPQPVDVKIDVGSRLQQPEIAPLVQAPQAPAAAPTVVTPQPIRPAAVAISDLPAAQPGISDAVSFSDAPVPSARPMPAPPPASGTVQITPSQQPIAGAAGVAARAPQPTAAKIAGVDPAVPAASASAGAAIERLTGPAMSGAAPAAAVTPNVPAAGAATGGAADSLAAAPGVGAKRSPGATAGLAGVAPNLPAGELVRNPEVAGPMMETTPLAGGEPQTPVVGMNQAVGLSRQDVPTGDLAGGAGVKSPLLPKVSTAGGGTPSLAGKVGPADAASAVTRMAGPSASVAPDPASASVATSAGVGAVTVQRPATQPSVAEPTLAGAIDGSTGAMQPTTRPAGPTVAASSSAPRISAVVPAAGPGADSGTTLAASPATRPAGAAVAAAEVRISGPAVGDPAGSAAMVAANIDVAAPRPAFSPVTSAAPELNAAPAAIPTAAKIDVAAPQSRPGGAGVDGIATATPTTPDIHGTAGGSIASATVVAPRTVIAAPRLPAPSVAGPGDGQALAGIDGPRLDLPKINAMPSADAGTAPGSGADAGRIAAAKADGAGPAIDRPVALAAAGVPGVDARRGQGGVGGPVVIAGPRPGVSPAPGLEIAPNISVSAPRLGVPEALFQRSIEQRRPMIEKLGGTQESEDAVERGLAWLARAQEPDGRWTYVSNSGKKSKSTSAGPHDMALTGLSVLAFLAADHSPAREGPYQQVVASGVDWLVSQQTDDGDLRGVKSLRGSGSGRANMYDHGIATMAVAEAALMTGDRRYMDAAFRAADFICDTQHKKTGGWRYLPGESGDTSVFGWQILALHNAELLGFQTPAEVRERSVQFLSLVSSGKTRILAGYTPGQGPTPPMTAEALFCRVLLEEPISDAQAKEVVEFLGRDQPSAKNKDLYYWYYMSLSMAQLQANPQVREAWDKWNQRCRDTLIATQARGGDQDGSWTDSRWGDQGGKVFSTALATLTLEVYYRYLPLDATAPAAAVAAPTPAKDPKKLRPRGPVGPKLEPN